MSTASTPTLFWRGRQERAKNRLRRYFNPSKNFQIAAEANGGQLCIRWCTHQCTGTLHPSKAPQPAGSTGWLVSAHPAAWRGVRAAK